MADTAPPPRTLLVTSGAYVGAELAAEFGALPPAFLPVGNRRLIAHQHAALAHGFDRIVLTLPRDFAVAAHDAARLAALGVETVPVHPALDLSQSVLQAIEQLGLGGGALAILHGDTLVHDIDPGEPDMVSVATTSEAYNWAGCRIEDDRLVEVFNAPVARLARTPVLSGYFHFADAALFARGLAEHPHDFVAAVQHYASRRPVRAVASERWLDFGHVHTYYASRGRITTERAFNSLTIGERVVVKRSTRADRIEAEAGWYEAMPADLRLFLPHYLGRDGAEGYAIEFLYMASLADLFVFGLLPDIVWTRILASCAEFLSAAAAHRAPPAVAEDAMRLYLPKTLARLEDYAAQAGIDLDRAWRINGVAVPSLRAIAHRSAARIGAPDARHLSIVHGDFCFSNILYDFRSRSVRAIDPRGQDAEHRPTLWGDNRYDLAKLHHSIIGCYDLIVAGYCSVEQLEPYSLNLTLPDCPAFAAARAAFDEVFRAGSGEDYAAVEAISLHLFLSMLPLHDDSPARQLALLANALRLYASIFGRTAA